MRRGELNWCPHCGEWRICRQRGLCWTCYWVTPGVREQYPPLGAAGRRGVPNFAGYAPPPAEPTAARPGTPEKIAVMGQRAMRGEQLCHPADGRDDLEAGRG